MSTTPGEYVLVKYNLATIATTKILGQQHVITIKATCTTVEVIQ